MPGEKRSRTDVTAFFKLNGFSIRTDACKLIENHLLDIDDSERQNFLMKIISILQKQSHDSCIVDEGILTRAIEECRDTNNVEDELFRVIDIFSVPCLHYDPEKKKFLNQSERDDAPLALYGAPNSKSRLFRHRFQLIQQSTFRNKLFAESGSVDSKFKLKTVEELLGSPGRVEAVVLALIAQLEAGKFFLEDLSGSVELDVSGTVFHTGLFCENCVVLAEGWYGDAVFHAEAIGFPPIETKREVAAQLGPVDLFGCPSAPSVRDSAALNLLESRNSDATFVFISDVWLDDLRVQEKLRQLFSGFRETPPLCFVFAGSFSASSGGLTHIKRLRYGFSCLADIILEFPELVNRSRFVFVPSLEEPALGNILPRPSLPSCVSRSLTDRVPLSHFTSNPCRLQFCSQQMVVFREDLVEKMSRNCLHMPSHHRQIPHHLMKTVQAQAHLCPLPVHVSPVYWDYDHCLRLYPLPDLLLLCDKYEPFTEKQNGCIVTNPGSFSRNKFCFQVYIPANRQVEDSVIRD